MIVVSIITILATVAVPSFRNFILNSQRADAVNDLMASFQLARSEAGKLGKSVVVCPSNTAGTDCAGSTTWSNGWLVYISTDNNTSVNANINPRLDERILQVTKANPSGPVVRSSLTAFSFRPFGGSNSNGNVRFCDSRGAESAKTIIVSQSGRARLSDVDASGNALSCS